MLFTFRPEKGMRSGRLPCLLAAPFLAAALFVTPIAAAPDSSGVPLVADGNGGMIVFHAPGTAADSGIRAVPDCAESLRVEYQFDNDATVRPMVRPTHGGVFRSSTWRTAPTAHLSGDIRIRCRWVVDGTPGNWSEYAGLAVTSAPLPRTDRIDYGDGIAFTLDAGYPVGQFADGEHYVVAPAGCVVTAATPATVGRGESLRHGSTIELHINRNALTGNATRLPVEMALVYDHNTRIMPGTTFVKAMSDEPYSHAKVGRMRTLTVLAERPPEGTFRPSPYALGDKVLRHRIEIDLARVPRLTYGNTFPSSAEITRWCDRFLARPGFPAGGGTIESRNLYPYRQMHPYHRGTVQDLALACHLIMARNLDDEAQRTALATAYVQRLLDIQASHRAAVLGGTYEAYYWEATTIFAGALLADTRMRGFHWYGEAGPRGDYDTWTSDGDPKYFTWDQMARGMGRLPDPKTFVEDMASDRDAEGWAALLRERTVDYAGPAFDGSHAGIVDNGDGTWTIPANRFAYGGLTARGNVPVLDPRGGWRNVLVPSAAWADRANLPHKIWSYRQQHNPKTANLALMLKAIGLIDYHTLSDVYANEAYEFMLFPEAWYHACGFPQRGPTDPWGYQVACPGARSDAHGYAVFGSWLNDVWMARWRDVEPHVRPGPPGACRTDMFRLHDRGNGSEVEVQLVDLPDDHFSRITDFELSVNGGPWTSMETNQVQGVYVVPDLPAGVPATIRLRAVNAHGPGAPSLGKRITPAEPADVGASRPVQFQRTTAARSVFRPNAVTLGETPSSTNEPVPTEEVESQRHRLVREFRPVGYWPADEGEGEVLHDRSGNGNHGRLFNLPWEDGLVDFTSGFQWAELPNRPEYQSASLSLGGWFFTRRDDYLGGSDLRGPNRNAPDNHHTHGVSLINNAYGRRGGWVRWDGIDNVREGVGLRLRSPGANRNVGGALLDVVHGNRADAIDSAFDGVAMTPGTWQHVLYTFHEGAGRLYLDGELAKTKDGVAYTPASKPFVIGNDMSWWMLYPTGSQSLDGSVRDLVLFDRALSAREAADLHQATRPDVSPRVYDADAVVVDGRHMPLERLPDATVDQRRRALEQWDARSAERIRTLPDAVVPVLADSLADRPTRRMAASLLAKLDRDEARAALRRAQADLFLPTLRDEAAAREERAASALALAAMGREAQAAVPDLAELLQELVDREGARLPRVEDLLRNSLIRALLDIAPQDDRVRHVLGRAFAQPILASLDLDRDYLAKVRPLVADERYMDALDVYRTLPLKQHGDFFLSQGDRHRDMRRGAGRDYASKVEHEGITYRVGSGRAWDAGEKITPDDYAAAVAELPAKFRRAAEAWNHADSPNLYRVRIHRTDPQGRTESALLEGPWFIFEGSDAKLLGWTIDVDERGYLHLIGGMHNSPNPGLYIPGSWEQMGLSRNRNDDNFPTVMYWVSRRPGDIASFEFVGQRTNPRNIPAPGMNYMNLVRDPDDVMFLYGRIGAQGIQSWGFYRYDAAARRWSAIGGDANDVFEATRAAHGDIFLQRGGSPWEPRPFTPAETVFVWAWQPSFYNYIRGWGVRFDRTGRMHVRVPIRALGTNARVRDAQVYAYSDDRGASFFRADGTPLALPLTANPAPGHHADLDHHASGHWLRLWHSLLRHAGYDEY